MLHNSCEVIFEGSDPVPQRKVTRGRLIAEIVVAYTLLELALWSRRPLQLWLGIAMLAVILVLTILREPGFRRLGLTYHGFRCAVFILPATLVAGGVLLAVGWTFGLAHPIGVSSRWHGAGYIVWAFIQQFMAQSFYFVRFEELLGSKRAVVVSALLFSLAHIPNPVLLPATFLGGLAFCETFRRWRNLYPIWLSHATLGMCVAASFPLAWTHQMRVGVGYLLLRH